MLHKPYSHPQPLMSQIIVTDLEQIKILSEQNHAAFEVLRYTLEFRDDLTDDTLDAWAEQLAAPITEAIDCTKCANCCRYLEVSLTKRDVQRLSVALDSSIADLETMYIEPPEEKTAEDRGKFQQIPCPFLCGNRCSVYEHRPGSCRIYPALTPDFRWTLQHTIEGAGFCPIIYNVLIKMVEEIDQL